jgi:L-aspartate oxidase
VGVRFYDQFGFPRDARAKATLLATGGAGQVFRHTTNPRVATGDGARLVNARGEAFMTRYHPDGDLAPRDVVARSIMREMEATGGSVFLSLSHLDPQYVASRFPTIADMCRQIRLDLARDPVPVSPAAHYVMGGVQTDVWGRTSLKGLFAAGEVACTGVHGANRLASNSLLEGLVFGARAAIAMQEPPGAAALGRDRRLASAASGLATRDSRLERSSLTTTEVRDLMWKSVGLFRTHDGMEDAVAKLEASYAAHRDALANARADDGDAWKQFNLVTVARLIARAALRRLESRGAHYRADYPERDDIHWKAHVVDGLTL